MKTFFFLLSFFFFLTLITACNDRLHNHVVITETFQTERDEPANIDSPTVWHGPDGEHWLIATAKEGNGLYIADATNGEHLRIYGSTGVDTGQFKRPNGITVFEDYLFVIERDNRRIQIVELPELKSLGFIAEDQLMKPYGVYIYTDETDSNHIFISDNYETADGRIPDPGALDYRLHHFTFEITSDSISHKLVDRYGATEGEGVLYVVESIYGDPANNVLLVAEEDTTQSCVKVYDLEGQFTGRIFGEGIFRHQVEGIALYEGSNGSGYWIITDQSHKENVFHVFTRREFMHVGSFSGPNTTNTDGVWLTQESFGPFEHGAFYAVHDDGNVSAFDWGQIAEKLGLTL